MPTNLKHIAELSITMRQEDRDEIWHLARMSPSEALTLAYNACEYVRTVTLNGAVVCIFGLTRVGDQGFPWMLASPLLSKIKKPFLRECRGYLEDMSKNCTGLFNVAWSKNKTHIQWIKWLGFEMGEGVPMGPDGEIYIPFSKVINYV